VNYDLTTFGTEARPLRASSLPRIVRCPLAAVLEAFSDERSSGPAADTGTAVHFAVRLWHREANKDARVAAEVMRRSLDRFPLADLDAASVMFSDYTNDRRNREAEVVLCEEQITFTLEAEEGETEEIVIVGTLDQVRRDKHGRLTVWDLKTGKPDGWDMLHEHALQLAAYQIGAGVRLKKQCQGAGIIRTQDYRRRNGPGPVFWEAPWSLIDAHMMLHSVRDAVRRIRSGRVYTGPGSHCRWCPQGGLAGCLPALREANNG
jgi:RecB family exonuclease